MTMRMVSLLAGTALASLVYGGAAQAVPVAGSSGGHFDDIDNCSGGDCGLANTGNGSDTQVRWGSTSSSQNLVNPSTLTSVDLAFGGNTNTSLRLGQLTWFNSATLDSQTDSDFEVEWHFSINFTQPAGSSDPNGTEQFDLRIQSPTNPPGDLVSGLTLADLDPGLTLTLNGVTISNWRYEVEDTGGDAGGTSCAGADTSFSNGVWRNCEGNTANLYIVADFTTPTSVPEPAALALFGAGLAGLGLFARRRRSA